MSGDTIRVCGTGSVLIGAEGRSPPLPFITVDADEGRALIAQKLAIEVSDDVEAPANAQADAEAAAQAEREAAEAAEAQAQADVEAEAGADGNDGGQEGATREQMIAEALDLMEAGDLVKNGDRAGKPKVSAIESATALTDVTADEIDAAVAARGAASA